MSLIGRVLKGRRTLLFASMRTNGEVKQLFGLRVAALRKVKGWPQEELAYQTGMARSYLSGVERGKRNIALVNICKLSYALDVTPAHLMNIDVGDEV